VSVDVLPDCVFPDLLLLVDPKQKLKDINKALELNNELTSKIRKIIKVLKTNYFLEVFGLCGCEEDFLNKEDIEKLMKALANDERIHKKIIEVAGNKLGRKGLITCSICKKTWKPIYWHKGKGWVCEDCYNKLARALDGRG
jgi:hypothetical protein